MTNIVLNSQYHLWDKPFHSITVYENPQMNSMRSLVTRFDDADMMIDDIQRTIDQHEKDARAPRIAYIQACVKTTDSKGFYMVAIMETFYPPHN